MLCCMLYYDEGTSRPGWLKTEQRMVVLTIPTVTAGHPSYAWWTFTTKISQAIQRIASTSIFTRVVFTGMLKKAVKCQLFQGLFNILCRPVIPVGPANVFWGGASIRVDVSLLHRRRAISWYAFGVAWLSSRGGGGFLYFDALPHLDAVCMQAMLLLMFQVKKQLTWRL